MDKPSEQKTAVTSELPNEQLKGTELTGQELDAVTGGVGKAPSGAKTMDDESPKESITFEYGGLAVQYTPQKPD